MADEHGLFWNSINGDRDYDSESMTEWLRKFFTTGVFKDDLFVASTGSMDISVSTGYTNINGKVRFFDTSTVFTIEASNSTYPRIDTVVIERNDTDRMISMKVVTGLYTGENPTPTAPVRANNIYQIVLANIYVGAGVTKLTQSNITDTRTDTSICGYVSGTVSEMDFSEFSAQFSDYYTEFKNSNQSDFNTWFNTIKGQLSDDAAGNLQNEIDTINTNMLSKASNTDLNTVRTSVTDLQNDGSYKTYTVSYSSWSSTKTAVDGTEYYTYQIAVTSIYDEHPTVSIGASGKLPKEDEQTAFDCVKQAYADTSTSTLTLYAEDKPESNFVIIVKGVA